MLAGYRLNGLNYLKIVISGLIRDLATYLQIRL